MRAALPILLAIILFSPACEKLEPKPAEDAPKERAEARYRSVRAACASQASYDRLKALIFAKAEQVSGGDAGLLDRLAASTVVRMEAPRVKSRDEALDVTVCTGRLIIELPPGEEDAFSGERRVASDVEYAAQATADGSKLVYQLDGADPIIYRLAAIDLANARAASPPPAPPETEVATARVAPPPVAAPPVAPAPAPVRRAAPVPEPQPARYGRMALARPSFNCRYARTRTEKMVCSDEELAERDRTMAGIYDEAVAVADPPTRAVLRRTRDRFLARRERCEGAGCVAAVYEDRIEEIDRIMTEQ